MSNPAFLRKKDDIAKKLKAGRITQKEHDAAIKDLMDVHGVSSEEKPKKAPRKTAKKKES